MASFLIGGAVTIGVSAAVFYGAPVVLGWLGFTKAGIAAGSSAASLMSSAAQISGGGISSGGFVATLQSIGAAGIEWATCLAVGKTIGTIATVVFGLTF